MPLRCDLPTPEKSPDILRTRTRAGVVTLQGGDICSCSRPAQRPSSRPTLSTLQAFFEQRVRGNVATILRSTARAFSETAMPWPASVGARSQAFPNRRIRSRVISCAPSTPAAGPVHGTW